MPQENFETQELDSEQTSDLRLQLAELQQEVADLKKVNHDLELRLQAYSQVHSGQTSLINKLIDQVHFGVLIVDKEQKIFHLNQVAAAYLESEPEKIRENLITRYIDFVDYQEVKELSQTGKNQLTEINLLNNSRDIAIDAFESDEGSETITVISMLDISEIKKAEKELRKLSKVKDDFLSMISHELRTPLNAIQGYSSLLKEELGETASQQTESFLNNIEAAGESMLRLVSNLLEYTSLMAGTVKPDYLPIDIDMIISQLQYRFEKSFNESKNRFEVNYPKLSPFSQDLTHLLRILYELLSNANKFSYQGLIKLDVTHHHDDEGMQWLEFKVSDTGCGMTDETLNNIFNAFEQADSSFNRAYEGLGLGLSIAEKTVCLLEGQMKVKSQINQGSEFTVRIPFLPI